METGGGARDLVRVVGGDYDSIQFKFICIALFTIQSLQSALQEIKFLQYIYTL